MEGSNVKGFFDVVEKPEELKDDDQRYWVGGGKTSGLITVCIILTWSHQLNYYHLEAFSYLSR